jgi:hypothetical protein
MTSEQDILDLIAADPWMMDALRAVRALALPDWWIGAGFVRGKVWDALHGRAERTPLADVDVIYFDPADLRESTEDALQARLRTAMPGVTWSATNQARMHGFHGDAPYRDSVDALSRWTETATCVAVRLRDDGTLELAAPFGIDDLVGLVVRPTASGHARIDVFRERVREKRWLEKWPRLRVTEE